MRIGIATTACAVLCLAFSGVAAQADVARTQDDGSFVLANMAPPEPEPPAANAPAEGTAPAEATPTDPAAAPAADPAAAPATDPAAAPAEGTAPAEATPAEATPAAEATTTATDAAAETPPASGGMPWLWIAVGVAIAGALGFGLWRRSAGG